MLRKLLLTSTGLGIIGLLLGFLGEYHWLLDAFSHFRVQYLFLFLSLLVISLIVRKQKLALVNGVLVLSIAGTLMKFYWKDTPSASAKTTLKLCAINLLSSNDEYSKVIDFIRDTDADVVVVQELSNKWGQQLNVLSEEYLYRGMLPRSDNFGIGILSKVPLEDTKFTSLSGAKVSTVTTTLRLQSQFITIIGTHPPPPVGMQQFVWRNEQLTNLSTFTMSQTTPVVLLGDLNCSSFSPNFRRLIDQSGLRDTRIGYGLQPTWPVNLFPLWVTIDHCLVSKDIAVLDRAVGPNIGSDHLPVIVTLDLLK